MLALLPICMRKYFRNLDMSIHPIFILFLSIHTFQIEMAKRTRLKFDRGCLFEREEKVPSNQLPTKLDVLKSFNYRRNLMDKPRNDICFTNF